MKKIIFILILLSIYGCNVQKKSYCERKKEKVARLIEEAKEHGCSIIDTTTRIDTITTHDTIIVRIPGKINKTHIDSLMSLYCVALMDTTTIVPFAETKADVIKKEIYRECSPEKVIGEGQKLLIHGKDTVIVKFKGTRTGIDLSIIDIKKEVHINKNIVVPCPSCKITLWQKVKQDFILWLIIALFFFLLGLFKR